jgi:hypothetical protein
MPTYIGDAAWLNNLRNTQAVVEIDGDVLIDAPIGRWSNPAKFPNGQSLICTEGSQFLIPDASLVLGAVLVDVWPGATFYSELPLFDWQDLPTDQIPDLDTTPYSYCCRAGPGCHDITFRNFQSNKTLYGIVLQGASDGAPIKNVTIDTFTGMPAYRGLLVSGHVQGLSLLGADMSTDWCENTALAAWRASVGYSVELPGRVRGLNFDPFPFPNGTNAYKGILTYGK